MNNSKSNVLASNERKQLVFNETYKTAVASTCNMSESDCIQLEEMATAGCSMTAKRPTGFFIKLYSDDPQLNLSESLSPELNAILVEAAEQGFKCIELDCDAENVSGAKVFEW